MQLRNVDNSQLDTTALRRALVVVTIIFVVFLVTIGVLGGLPSQPNQVSPYDMSEWPALREEQNQQLTQYGWINQENGVVRIPIDRAKDLLVERSLPTTANP